MKKMMGIVVVLSVCMADPEWKKAKAESETNGVLVKEVKSKNLKATDYSPIR